MERAVASVFDAGLAPGVNGGVRVTVVCHNIEPGLIRSKLAPAPEGALRFLSCQDGIPSPAGPFNMGVAAAEAEFVSIMGSDDYLEEGALAGWLAVAREHASDAVIAPQRHANGAKVRTPPVRVGRSRALDPVLDRLSYRTAPLGLLRRSEIERLDLRFSEGRRSGEDQEFSAKLWFGGGRIDYARRAGSYVVGADAQDRVTSELRPVSGDLSFATDLAEERWFRSMPAAARQAVVTKLIRVHVFGTAHLRSGRGTWDPADRAGLAAVARTLQLAAPGCRDVLSIADVRLLDCILDPDRPDAELARLAAARRRFGRPETLLAKRWSAQFAPEAPLRFMLASALL